VQQALKEAGRGERGSLTLADFEAALRGADLSDMQVCCQTLQTTIIACFLKGERESLSLANFEAALRSDLSDMQVCFAVL